MADPYLAEIRMFGGNFAPRGWALCNGQLLSIAQNTALFSLLGTTYGGDGKTTFALPDLRGRAPIHFGQGPGLTPRDLGESDGTETVTLLTTEMPAHTHLLNCNNSVQFTSSPTPEGSVLGTVDSLNLYAPNANTTMSPTSIGVSGSSQPHNNMQPYLCVNFIIALEGIFPPRS